MGDMGFSMTQSPNEESDLNLFFPLNLFYEQLGLPLPVIEQVSGAEVPEPYRRLLVHDDDMTGSPALGGV